MVQKVVPINKCHKHPIVRIFISIKGGRTRLEELMGD